MRLRPALAADFGFIRGMVQRPDYAQFLTDEDEAALAAYAAGPGSQLLIAETDQGVPLGFALFCEIGEPSGRVELRRLALDQVNGGQGVLFLRLLIEHGFAKLGAAKLWLDASGENLRAQRVYEKVGFTLEGRLRKHWYRPSLGRAVDELLYGMFRDEWLALRDGAAAKD